MTKQITELAAKEMAVDLVLQMVTEGKTIQEAAGVSDELLEEIYTLAYSHYTHGRYTESIALFQFLTGIAPYNSRFLLGLAASYQETSKYQDAIQGYFFALNANPEDPMPALYAAECYLKENNKEAAKDFLQAALELAGDKESFKTFRERCSVILDSLK